MIVKIRNKSNFAQISNKTLRDKRLSLETRGALAEILSYSEDFETSVESLMTLWGIGRGRLLHITNELKTCGYLKIEPRRDAAGKIICKDWIFFGESQSLETLDAECANVRANHRVENPNVGENHRVENPHHIYKDLNTDLKRKERFKNKELETRTEGKCACEIKKSFSRNSFSSESAPDILTRQILSGIRARLKLEQLPPNHNWFELCQFAYANKFTSEQVLLCYDTLERQRLMPQFWRKGRTTAGTVIQNLSHCDDLIDEINQFENGVSNTDGRLQKTNGYVDSGTRNEQRNRNSNALIAELFRQGELERANQNLLGDDYAPH